MRDEHLFASLDEARRIMLDHVGTVGTEMVGLPDALGRVLRQNVISDIDYPRSDVSSMDGYCVRSDDTAGASQSSALTLQVRGKSTPGAEPPRLEPGTCVLITTGAPLAVGADAVVKYEDAEEHGGIGGESSGEGDEVESITIREAVAPGTYVRRQGEVARAGDTVLSGGEVVTPAVLGILASFAGGSYEVSRRLRAGVLATGDELVPSGADLPGYAVRDSNSPTLAGLLKEAGCEVIRAGRVEDTEEGIAAALEEYGDCDVVMISGGVSGGRFDFVPASLEGIGATVILRGVKMRPGKPVLFAMKGKTAYLGVPGNPVAVVASFQLLFRPVILAMMGRSDCLPAWLEATSAGVFKRKSAYVTFAPALLGPDLAARPTRFLGSGDIMSLADANCLVCVPEDVEEIGPGEAVRVYPFSPLGKGGEA